MNLKQNISKSICPNYEKYLTELCTNRLMQTPAKETPGMKEALQVLLVTMNAFMHYFNLLSTPLKPSVSLAAPLAIYTPVLETLSMQPCLK